MRILNAEPCNFSPEAKAILQEIGEVVEESCDRNRLLEIVSDFDVLIVRLGHRIDKEVIEKGHQLKAILTATTGLNHIDLTAAAKNDISILSLKGERAFLDTLTATAELTWGLLLALLRKIPSAYNHVLAAGWDRDQYRGRQLKDKVLGIVGFGRLGSIVAEYGRAFQMKVLTTDPYVSDVPHWIKKITLYEMLECVDVVSLHVNLDQETYHLFNEEAFARIKPGAFLVNTSRGELIDERELISSLNCGRLAGAALDVLKGEAEKHLEWPRNSELWRYACEHNNLLLVPHIGGATSETMAETEVFMSKKLKKFIQEYN